MEIKKYYKIIKKRLWIIGVCVLISCMSTVMINNIFIPSQYEASTKIIVNKLNEDELGLNQMDLNSLNTSIMLIQTYKELILTPAILNQVISSLPQFNLSSDELFQILEVSSSERSQIMTVTATYDTYEEAATISNAVANVFKEAAADIMIIGDISILLAASTIVDPVPINTSLISSILISFIVSFMFSIGLIFLLEHLDDTFRVEDDVYELVGIKKIGAISIIKKRDFKLIKSKNKNSTRQRGEGPYATHNS